MSGWMLICIPIAAAAVATGQAVKPRPKMHPAPRPSRPVAAPPRVPDALARHRPRVVRPRPVLRAAPALACHWVRAPAWAAGLPGGFAPGWWPGYAPAGGYGGWGGYGPTFAVPLGGAWGGPGSWGGGFGGGWSGGPSYVPVAYPLPVVAAGAVYAFASAEATALALAVVTVVVNAPPVGPPAPGSITPGVDLPGSPPPGSLPPGSPSAVPEAPAVAVFGAGLIATLLARRVRAGGTT